MSKQEPDFRPLDPGRVNTLDEVEVVYWCREFGCEPDLLQQAVSEVGEHVTEIREWLARVDQG